MDLHSNMNASVVSSNDVAGGGDRDTSSDMTRSPKSTTTTTRKTDIKTKNDMMASISPKNNKYQTKTPRKTMSAPPSRWKQRVDEVMGGTSATKTSGNDDDNNNDDDAPVEKRTWTVKRVLSNDSFRRENPGSLPPMQSNNTTGGDDDGDDDDDDYKNRYHEEESDGDSLVIKSYKVKRILSQDSFRRENPDIALSAGGGGGSGPSDVESTLTSTLPRTIDEECHYNDEDNDEEDGSESPPKRSWTVKRVLSNDSFRRENPKDVLSDNGPSSTKSGDTNVHDEAGEEEEEISPMRSWKAKRVITNDEYWEQNKPLGSKSSSVHGEKVNTIKPNQAPRHPATIGRSSLDANTTHIQSHAAARSPRRHIEDQSGYEKDLMMSKTSHLPLKKSALSRYQNLSPKGWMQKESINSRCSEDSSDCGLDFGTTHSTTSFASSVDEDDKEEEDLEHEVTRQSSPQRKSSLSSRINTFEHKNDDNRGGTRMAGGILSPRHEQRGSAESSRSAHGRSPGALKTKIRSSNANKSPVPVGPPTTPRASNARKPVKTPRGASSLKDRIGMFNKNATLPDFMRISKSPSFGVKKLVAKPSSKSRSKSKLKAMSSSRKEEDDFSPEMSLRDLLPPPKKSLDQTNTESVLRRADKMAASQNSSFNGSFNRRGRLKATKSALLGKKDESKRDIFTAIAAPNLDDLSNFQPPEFKKDPDSIKVINAALRKNFVFNEMNDDDRERFVKAFEEVVFERGQTIINQGDAGDFFYIIAYGEVSFHVNKKKVGSTGKGNSFGEISLLYTCPRAATVIAESPSTKTYRVDQKTFRFLMQSQTKESEEKKRKLIRGIKFLENLREEDLVRLSSVTTPCIFSTGDYIVKRGEQGDSFYIIHEGKVRVTDIVVGSNSYEDVTLESGDYFGEGALISSEARTANVVALTKGTAFAIDRTTFQRVLGDFVKVIRKAQDHRRLVSQALFRFRSFYHFGQLVLTFLHFYLHYRRVSRFFGRRTYHLSPWRNLCHC
jgi:cAMP-dependent protein kinase regulator